MDLFNFDHSPTSDDEHRLSIAMQKQWKEDLDTVRARGVIPDWIGEPSPLSRDKARLLEYLYDAGYVAWHSYPCQNNRDVTKAIGLNSTANAKAVIDICHSEGLIESRIYRDELVFQMTQEGEYALEEWQIEKEMGLL